MTAPGAAAPDGAITGGDVSPLNGLSESAWRASVKAPVDGSFEAARVLWSGAFSEQFDQTAQMLDEQSQYAHQSELLAEVSAYVSAVMGNNWQLPTNGSWVTVPFDVQLGPSRNGWVVAEGRNSHVRVEGGGLWRADLLMSGRGATTDQGVGLGPPLIPGSGIPTIISTFTAYPIRIDYRLIVIQGGQMIAMRDYISAGVPFNMYSEYADNATAQVDIQRSSSCAATFVFDPDMGPASIHVQARAVPYASGWLSASSAKIFGGTMLSALNVTRWSTDDVDGRFVDNPPTAGTL